MKNNRIKLLAGIGLMAITFTGCGEKSSSEVILETNQDSVSYALGRNLGTQLMNDGVEVNPEIFKQGVADVFSGNDKMSDEETGRILQKWAMNRAKTQGQQEGNAQQSEAARQNLIAGKNFLLENEKNPDVNTMPEGIQYKVLRKGNGASPTLEDRIKIHYKGTTIDGKVFDSSYDRGEPITFPLNGLIRGWQIALPKMKEGAKWELYIPSELAYGENAPPAIGPNQTLIFEIELIEVNPADK